MSILDNLSEEDYKEIKTHIITNIDYTIVNQWIEEYKKDKPEDWRLNQKLVEINIVYEWLRATYNEFITKP